MSAPNDRSSPPPPPAPPLEVEAKYSIEGEGEFRRFLACAGTPASVREQLNCYLDAPRGDLGRMGWAARIRLTEDEAVLTLKGAVAGTRGSPDGVFRAVEIERGVPRALAVAWLNKTGKAVDGPGEVVRTDRGLLDPGPQAPREVRDFLCSGRAALVTWSLTLRWTFRDPGRPDLIADETWFPDGSRDFEVEVECRVADGGGRAGPTDTAGGDGRGDHSEDIAAAKARAHEVARAAGVTLAPQTLTKHARALRHVGMGPYPIPAGLVTSLGRGQRR